MRWRLCCSLLGSVAVCTSNHKLHWCYFSCPIFCAGYVMGAVKQEQIWICACWGFPLDVIPLDLFLSFWKSCFMSSGRSVAMPYFFHVLTSCQLRCQKVDLLKCSVFSFCLMVFRLFLGGFLFDWTSRCRARNCGLGVKKDCYCYFCYCSCFCFCSCSCFCYCCFSCFCSCSCCFSCFCFLSPNEAQNLLPQNQCFVRSIRQFS